MKPVYALIILALIIYSCKKEEAGIDASSFVQTIMSELKDSVSRDDYASLDLSKAVYNKVDSVGLYFLRIPFKGKSIINDFIIVKTSKNGKVFEGRIVQLSGGIVEVGEGSVKNREWEGSISPLFP